MPNYNYHCFNMAGREKCDTCSKNGQVVTEEKGDYECPCDGSPLKHIGEIGGSASIKTPTRTRIALDQRKVRNKEHFKKEVLPSITDPDAQRHHKKKLGYKS